MGRAKKSFAKLDGGSQVTLTFTGPNQQLTTVVSVNVPLGNNAGDYSWKIRGTNWPAGVTDPKATINATISPPTIDTTVKPVITNLLPANGSIFVYDPATGPISFQISFDATVAANGTPISGLGASIGVTQPLTPIAGLVKSGVGTLAASGVVTSPNITDAGPHTIVVSATNSADTTEATTQINIHTTP